MYTVTKNYIFPKPLATLSPLMAVVLAGPLLKLSVSTSLLFFKITLLEAVVMAAILAAVQKTASKLSVSTTFF